MNPFDVLKNLNMESMKENLEKIQGELEIGRALCRERV